MPIFSFMVFQRPAHPGVHRGRHGAAGARHLGPADLYPQKPLTHAKISPGRACFRKLCRGSIFYGWLLLKMAPPPKRHSRFGVRCRRGSGSQNRLPPAALPAAR